MTLPDGAVLRQATGDDSERVAAHIAAVYAEHGLAFELEFEDDLIDIAESYALGAFWLVEADGSLLATAAVLPNGACRLFKRLYIAPQARRGGLARQLLRHACGWGDFVRTELWSDVRFRTAHRLYLSEGFAPGPTRILGDADSSVERSFWRWEGR